MATNSPNNDNSDVRVEGCGCTFRKQNIRYYWKGFHTLEEYLLEQICDTHLRDQVIKEYNFRITESALKKHMSRINSIT